MYQRVKKNVKSQILLSWSCNGSSRYGTRVQHSVNIMSSGRCVTGENSKVTAILQTMKVNVLAMTSHESNRFLLKICRMACTTCTFVVSVGNHIVCIGHYQKVFTFPHMGKLQAFLEWIFKAKSLVFVQAFTKLLWQTCKLHSYPVSTCTRSKLPGVVHLSTTECFLLISSLHPVVPGSWSCHAFATKYVSQSTHLNTLKWSLSTAFKLRRIDHAVVSPLPFIFSWQWFFGCSQAGVNMWKLLFWLHSLLEEVTGENGATTVLKPRTHTLSWSLSHTNYWLQTWALVSHHLITTRKRCTCPMQV